MSLLLAASAGMAQNNAMKVNDEVYAMYLNVQTYRNKPQGLVLAKEMYKRAEELGDKKGMTMAMSIVVMHSSYECNYQQDNLDRALDKLKELAEKYGYWQYYYFGTNWRIRILINKGRQREALQFAKSVQEEAKRRHHKYGIYNGYKQIGQIRLQTGDPVAAIRSFKQALKYGLEHCPEQDMGTCYAEMCVCAETSYDFNTILNYAEEGLKISHSTATQKTLRYYKTFALFILERYDEFLNEYRRLPKNASGWLNDTDTRMGIVLNCFYSVMTKGDIKLIETKINANHLDTNSIFSALYACYKYLGMYHEAYILLMVAYIAHINESHLLGYENMSSTEVHFNSLIYTMEKEREEVQLAELSLTNSRLKLSNAKLEKDKATQAESLSRMNAENLHLNYQNKRFEALQLSDSLNILKTEHAAHEQKNRSHTVIMTIIVITILIVLGVIAYAARRIRRYSLEMQNANAQLRRNNSQLAAEQEKAEKANASKAAFIHNMTREIHNPLAAITEAALLLSGKDSDYSAEKKMELGNIVNAKTAELLALIDMTVEKTKNDE